jgi:ParB-like chromosome segregation protein Spo0J
MAIDNGPAAVFVPLDKLKPWAKNPRKNDSAVTAVANSIVRFGFGAPLLARKETGEIIAGHTRLKAAIRLKLEAVPVRYLDITETEAHALAIADNKVGEIAEWDAVVLADVLRDLEAAGAKIDDLGFDAAEIAALMSDGSAQEGEEGETGAVGDGLVYRVVVDVRDEGAQADLVERLEAEGYKCAPLIS